MMTKRFLSKSKLSQYLRTQCDRQLYLSLFSNDAQSLANSNLPIPIKTRTSVQLITKSGREFEYEQFDTLVRALPKNVVCNKNYGPIDLNKALKDAPIPCFILQPEFEPEKFRNRCFDNLGLTDENKATIPPLVGLRPDVLFLHDPTENDYEVLPNGNRNWIDHKKETRKALSVIDLKNVIEANASYSAEVCLYAFFLSNWLEETGLNKSYYVSHKVYLWKNAEMLNFQQVVNSRQGGDPLKRIEALTIDLEEGLVEFLIYMPSVKKFFKEDIPRVVTKGDKQGWQAVDYHVNPKCGSCDWLGNKDWLWGDSLKIYEANPDHYCLHAADVQDHLSKMAGISRGASQILANDGKTQLAHLVDIPAATPVLKRHTFLKKDKSQIGTRARAIVDGVASVDDAVRIGGLARFRNAEYSIVVNFDAGAGILTGIAIRGVLFFPKDQQIEIDGEKRSYLPFHAEAFVIGKDNHVAEGASLMKFIERLAGWIARAEKIFTDNNWGPVHSQIYFWEKRQYQELCNAFGRHLLDVLNLSDRDQRALAWLFPAEELIEKDQQVAPVIVFIQDIIDACVRPGVKFANTLLGVVSAYHHEKSLPPKIDKYYVEPLGNAIPRERIFEIWKSPAGTVRYYGKDIPVADAVIQYGDVLKEHTKALSSIVSRLRQDIGERLDSRAPALKPTIPQGARQVAFDSKLWIQWDFVEAATALTEGKINLITKAERLEASYKAIVLEKPIKDLGNYRYSFAVSEESTESKIEEGATNLVLGYVDDPGFPLRTPASFGIQATGAIEAQSLWIPIHKIIRVTIHSFDRANKSIEISVHSSWQRMEPLFQELMDQGIVSLTDKQIYLLEGLPYDDSGITESILRSVGNPTNAKVGDKTLQALGMANKKKIAAGTDAVTPLSRVLWEADVLANTDIRTEEQAKALASYARASNKHGLNESQEDAVFHCSGKQLSTIWGPPGTGKTDTLGSLVQAIVNESQKAAITKKVLITGPNYRAVEELADRIVKNIDRDDSCHCDMFVVYTQSRIAKDFGTFKDHFNFRSFSLRQDPTSEQELLASLADPDRITIVATVAHAGPHITKLLHGKDADLLQAIYDLVIIDESSQVPINLALRPLAGLKPTGQIIIAGDHLQMPPIAALEPPKGAEYLVGSIQTYIKERFPKIPMQRLLINYRSNQDLVDFAKTLGYPSELTAHEKERRLNLITEPGEVIASLPAGLPATVAYEDILDPDKKVITLIHEDIVSSQANELEAKLVASMAYCLRRAASSDLFPSDSGFAPFSDEVFFKRGLGVVTPHKAQKALVLRELRTLFPDVTPELIFEAVDTVERFQGGERQTIIVSFGVGDTDIISGEEAFLLQMERTNVAVSRAKAKCIVLMPKALAYHLPGDEKVAKASKAVKSYIEEFCSQRREIDITEQNGTVRKGEIRWH